MSQTLRPAEKSSPADTTAHPSPDGRDHAVSLAKAIGIIAVVAHHLANRRFPEPERGWIGLLGDYSHWAVPLFILVSGYLHGRSDARRGQPKSVASFLASRALRLLVPYTLVSLVYAILYVILIRAHLLADASGTPTSWYLLWIGSLTLRGGVGEQLYFLPLLFIISAIAVLIVNASRSPRIIWWSGVTLMVAAILFPDIWQMIPGKPIWSWDQLVAGVALYLLGYALIFFGRPKNVEKPSEGTSYLPLITCAAGALWLLALYLEKTSTRTGIHPSSFLFPLVLFPLLLLGQSRIRSRLFESVGDASGTTYLYHTPFFLQPLLVIIATKTPAVAHVPLAYGALIVTIAFFTWLHFRLIKTPLKVVTF